MTPAEARIYLEKIPEDEPVFIFRARDRNAPAAIASWASLVQSCHTGATPSQKQIKKGTQAMQICREFRNWQVANSDKVKTAD